MTRSYDMTMRDRSAKATRRNIIDAAHRLLGRPDGGSLTLQEVADEAGVSRATIYNRIGSRSELLTAVFLDQGRLIDFDRVLQAMKLDDPAESVLETVRESCRAWEVMPVAIRRTKALAVLDPEIGELVTRFEGYRRQEIAQFVERVVSRCDPSVDGTAEGLSPVLALITSFESYDVLRHDHDPAAATGRLVQLAATAFGFHIN